MACSLFDCYTFYYICKFSVHSVVTNFCFWMSWMSCFWMSFGCIEGIAHPKLKLSSFTHPHDFPQPHDFKMMSG